MKPIVRAIPHGDLYSTINEAIRKFIVNSNNNPFQNCLNCIHWKQKEDKCGLYNAKPPAEIIVYSCPSYTDIEEIPY